MNRVRLQVLINSMRYVLMLELIGVPLAVTVVWFFYHYTGAGLDMSPTEFVYKSSFVVTPVTTFVLIFVIALPIVYYTRRDAFFIKAREKLAVDARAQAVEASEQRAHFLAVVSHEIRNPLNGILGVTSSIDARQLDDNTANKLNVIKQSAEDLLFLLNDLLDMSKVDAGQIDLEPRPTDLLRLFNDVEVFWHNSAEAKSIELVFTVDAAVPNWVLLDGHRFRQIINNLVSNAIKFTNRGSVAVSVRYDNQDNMILIEVADTGRGIPLSMREKIFQPYSQVNARDDGVVTGTGLGLPIARQLATIMGGGLELLDSTNAGSHFQVAVQARPTVPIDVSERAGQEISDEVLRSNLRVIVGDDSAASLVVARELLKAIGINNVQTVPNRDEMLENLRSDHYDIALIDDNFGDHKGADILNEVSDCFVGLAIAYTGRTDVGLSFFESQGFHGYLSKPVDADRIRTELVRVLSAAQKPHADIIA